MMKALYIFTISFLILSCANGRDLYDRGYNREDRLEFIKYNFTDMDDSLKDAFKEGRLTIGMPEQIVTDLIGPGRLKGNIWEYVLRNNKIGFLKFRYGKLIEISPEMANNPKIE